MTARSAPRPCPGAETLAAFVEGKLTREEIRPVLEHLDACARCRSAVAGTHERHAPSTTVPWTLAPAAAPAAIVVSIPFLRHPLPAAPRLGLPPPSGPPLE